MLYADNYHLVISVNDKIIKMLDIICFECGKCQIVNVLCKSQLYTNKAGKIISCDDSVFKGQDAIMVSWSHTMKYVGAIFKSAQIVIIGRECDY